MSKLKKINRAIKDGNLKVKLFNRIRSMYTYRKGVSFIADNKVRELQSEVRVANHMRKKYKSLIEEGINDRRERVPSNKVWICWLQGYEAAPDFIKACINSAKINMPNREIIILTEQNIKEYISFPKYIEEKRKKGIISRTHYSDLLRVSLLVKYGGLWIDSTVLCTGSSVDFNVILNAPLFVYKQLNLTPNSSDPIASSNWLISAYSNSSILMLTQKLLYQYWRDYNTLVHYFIFHIFMNIAVQRYQDEWDDIPTFNNHSPHVLGTELDYLFSETRWSEYLAMSSFHKLNRHVNFGNICDSNYSYILKKYGVDKNIKV